MTSSARAIKADEKATIKRSLHCSLAARGYTAVNTNYYTYYDPNKQNILTPIVEEIINF